MTDADDAINWAEFDPLLDAAIEEDAARADATTRALVPEGLRARALVVARERGVVCGLPLAARLVERFDPALRFEAAVGDGDAVWPGVTVARLDGRAASILSLERTMLNFLQRLSGIASLTARFVEAVAGTGALIYDTRKTAPGWRALEKYAVRCGGGRNHRMDLASEVLIKDNHLALLGAAGPQAVREAVERARAACPGLAVEVEVEDMAQLQAALEAAPEVVMADYMTPEQVRAAAELLRRRFGTAERPLLEVSGGVTLQNVAAYAAAGADRIAVGALTHSAPALDLAVEMAP